MDDYARAAARVHTALCALQVAPETLRATYADDFTRELVRRVPLALRRIRDPLTGGPIQFEARTVRRKHKLPRMKFILRLTKMIAETCKPPGAYGLVPALFARAIADVRDRPDVEWAGELGGHQWWTELQDHQWWMELGERRGGR
jgi:hypothetical protein